MIFLVMYGMIKDKRIKGQRQLEFGFRNAEFGRKDEKSDQGGRIEAAKLGSWEATEFGIGKAS